MLQAFGGYAIGNISVPVIGFKGTEDDLLGGQEDDFFAQLNPEILLNSTLLTFDAASGGALHNQVGSPYIRAARSFAKLNTIMAVCHDATLKSHQKKALKSFKLHSTHSAIH